MPSVRELLSSVIMTAVGVAVIFRVEMLRSIVAGIETDPVSKTDPKAKRMLYV